MTDAARFAAEIDAFERVIAGLTELARRGEGDQRSDLVRLRKQLAGKITAIREIGIRVLEPGDPAVLNEFRSRLSVALNVTAMHQASWPAVTVDVADEDYRRSAAGVAESNRAFIAWMLAAIPQAG